MIHSRLRRSENRGHAEAFYDVIKVVPFGQKSPPTLLRRHSSEPGAQTAALSGANDVVVGGVLGGEHVVRQGLAVTPVHPHDAPHHSVTRRRATIEEEKWEETQPSPHRHADEPPFKKLSVVGVRHHSEVPRHVVPHHHGDQAEQTEEEADPEGFRVEGSIAATRAEKSTSAECTSVNGVGSPPAP